jgi:hypothetical protein
MTRIDRGGRNRLVQALGAAAGHGLTIISA